MKKALLIGINYKNTSEKHSNITELYGCINDVLNMANILMDGFEYEKKNITVLRDDLNTHSDFLPTKTNIINKLNQLISELNDDDELCVYYSGHGSGVLDNNNDETDGRDEIIVPIDIIESGSIRDDDICNILVSAKCSVMLFFDCCNSGTVCDLPWKFSMDGENKNLIRSYEVLNNQTEGPMVKLIGKDIYMMSGCRDNQSASGVGDYEYGMNRGAFSVALTECIRFNKHNVSLLKLYMDVCTCMGEMEQKPIFSSTKPIPNYYFSRFNSLNVSNSDKSNSLWSDDGITTFYTAQN